MSLEPKWPFFMGTRDTLYICRNDYMQVCHRSVISGEWRLIITKPHQACGGPDRWTGQLTINHWLLTDFYRPLCASILGGWHWHHTVSGQVRPGGRWRARLADKQVESWWEFISSGGATAPVSVTLYYGVSSMKIGALLKLGGPTLKYN